MAVQEQTIEGEPLLACPVVKLRLSRVASCLILRSRRVIHSVATCGRLLMRKMRVMLVVVARRFRL